MNEIKLFELSCIRCGGQLKAISNNTYQCKSCGKTFEKQIVTDIADQIRAVLNEQKQEAVANLRRQLWAEMHEQYINSEKIVDLARDIKKYLPEDYFANFCEIANSGNDKQVNDFLNSTSQSAMADYADIVLDFMLKSMTAANLTAISLFIERAFKGDTQSYDKYINRYEQEAQKVNSGIYELLLTRDVFLAYSSADIEKVLELCDYLESNNITCFLALRNLRHGRGAVDNYDRALQTAIDNCKTVVFVSSTNSRSLTCDALTKELPYIRQKDIDGAPAEYKRAYDKMPAEFMMPRVEYLVEDYTGSVAEMMTKEFFHSLEWCKSKEAVAARIGKYLTETHKTVQSSQVGANVDYETLAAQFAEEQRKIAEEQRKAEQARLKAEAEKKALDDFRRNSEVNKGVLIKYKGYSRNVFITNNVTSMGELAFQDCNSLESVTIPDSVIFIDNSVFYGCDLLSYVNVSEGNTKYKSIDGNLYSKDGKTLVMYACGKTNISFKIPEGVTSIGKYAFSNCKWLENVIIPDSVTSIGYGAFLSCTALTSVIIGRGVTAIEPNFGYCKALTSLNVSEDNAKFKSIDGNLYSKDGKVLVRVPEGKTSLKIPSNVTSIGEGACGNCELLSQVTIPDSVTSIGGSAFSGCRNLYSVTIGSGVVSMGSWVFADNDYNLTICCRIKKPFLSLPKGWDKEWIKDYYSANCRVKVKWNHKGN